MHRVRLGALPALLALCASASCKSEHGYGGPDASADPVGETFNLSGTIGVSETEIETAPYWVDVAAGNVTSCGVWSTGEVACWGGDPDLVAEVPAGDFVQVVMSMQTACARDTSGMVVCWGRNGAQYRPPEAAFSRLFKGGGMHICGEEAGTGALLCWGVPDAVPLGLSVAGAFVTAGNERTCVVTGPDEAPICWGSAWWPDWVLVPPEGIPYELIAIGSVHACGIDVYGDVHCWGAPALNGCDDPYPHGCYPPCPFPGPFVDVVTWNRDTCVQDVQGFWSCWVNDAWPVGPLEPPYEPMVKLDVGNFHACGLTEDGRILCFGNEAHSGELDPPLAP